VNKKQRQAADEFVQERYRRGLKRDIVPDLAELPEIPETARVPEQRQYDGYDE
jgi:hypothetical protein